jgi:hypothetical protein
MSLKAHNKPNDVDGAPLQVGDLVQLLEIPNWLTHNLPPEDVSLLEAELHKTKRIQRFDAAGYAWFAADDGTEWFCLRPVELRRIAAARRS